MRAIFGQLDIVYAVGAVFALCLLALPVCEAGDTEDRTADIEIELTESFYRALRAEGAKTYSTSKSEEYLRQIAVSSRFIVESNLKIIKGQEQILDLLEQIRTQNGGGRVK